MRYEISEIFLDENKLKLWKLNQILKIPDDDGETHATAERVRGPAATQGPHPGVHRQVQVRSGKFWNKI